MTEYATLLFPGRRVDGALPVTDPAGNALARITVAKGGGRFTAATADGSTVCQGRTSRWSLSGTWRVTGAAGGALLSVTAKPLRSTAAVSLADGRRLVVHGSPWRRGFTVTDQDGRTVLTGTPRTGALSPRQYDYAVRQPTPGSLQLAEVIAIVQVWRMVQKSEAAVLAASTVTSTATA